MTFSGEWRDGVSQAIAEAFHAVDSGEPGKSIDLCTDDFTMKLPGMDFTREQYVGLMDRRAAADYDTRHCASNFRLIDSSQSSVTVSFTVASHRFTKGTETTSVNVADFTDEWLLSDGEWLLRARSIAPAFATPVA